MVKTVKDMVMSFIRLSSGMEVMHKNKNKTICTKYDNLRDIKKMSKGCTSITMIKNIKLSLFETIFMQNRF